MIQLQTINYVLNKRDFASLRLNNITQEYFNEYPDEYKFIEKHYDEFGKIPDKETFISYFPDFKFIDVQESPRYLLDSLREEYVYRKAFAVFQSVNKEMMEGDSRRAVELLLSRMPELTRELNVECTDLLHDGADKRFQQYCDTGADVTKFYIPTGLPELDERIGGWNRKNDFVAICGRPGQGKSWWMDFFLLKAAEQGYTVGLYSGEMDEAEVGYRIDTFVSHISNFKISKGHSDIFDNYQKHIETIKSLPGKFLVCTPRTLGGPATPAKIRAFCERYNIDILGIDQYSLLDSAKNTLKTNEKYADISQSIKIMQQELGIPILINAQLNRATGQDGQERPGTENIAGSDRLGQDCSVVLNITSKDDLIRLVSSKVRSASSKFELTYKWDIDKGLLEYQEQSSTRTKPRDEDEDVPPSKRRRTEQTSGDDIKF